MFKHTLLFLVRLLERSFGYHVVSILGLSVSLASFLLISTFVRDEISYDKFHDNYDRIFRITTHLRLNDIDYNEASSQFPASAALKSEFPEIKEAVRIFPRPIILERGNIKLNEPKTIFADSNFFKVFSFKILLGDPNTFLRSSASVVLTSAASARYFGKDNPIGKELVFANQSLVVTGVIENIPEQSHLKFDVLIPLEFQLSQWKNQTGLEGRENKWFWTGAYNYVLLHSKDDASKIIQKLPAFVSKYFPQRYKDGNGRLGLQPLGDIHLKSNLDAELEPGGSALYVNLFIAVGIIIMLVSSINLINLSHFKMMGRVKEIGIRKFLGQSHGLVSFQFVMEGAVIGMLAFLFGMVLAQIFIPYFNLLVGKNLRLFAPSNLPVIAVSVALIMVISLAAVAKPAIQYARESARLLLTRYKNLETTSSGRNFLIGLQVSTSFILLVFALVVNSQLSFFKDKDLGFDKDFVIAVTLNEETSGKFKSLKTEWLRHKNVVNVAGAEYGPGVGYSAFRFVPEGGSYEKPMMLPFSFCDHDFLSTMNIELVEGNNFSPNSPTDSLPPLLINRQAANDLGWSQDALGKKLEVFAPGTTDIMLKGKVIGVFENFHSESLHKPIKPLVIAFANYHETALIKISKDNPVSTAAELEAVWKTFSDKPFQFVFLEKQLEQLYANETKLGNIILFFSIIALYLTCYGLFAMSSLLFTTKLKDVAVRKVFGADRVTIAKHLYGRYLMFKLAAIAIGFPIVFWLSKIWLNSFQYGIDLTPIFFVQGAGIILLVGVISVVYYLVRVANSNPIEFLKTE
jgi:putative ABC transport system permease protein